MQPLKGFSKKVREIDPEQETAKICNRMRELLARAFRRRGYVVAVSGGIDSSVTLALAAKAVGPERVLALLMPETHSAPETLDLSRLVADCFKVVQHIENISAVLEAVGFYDRYAEAVRRVIPGYDRNWKSKIVLPSMLDHEGYRMFSQTEIYDYLRLLFARVGITHCPICGREVVKQSAQEIVDRIAQLPDVTRILILSPLVRARKETYQAVFEEIRKAGFTHTRGDGTVYSLDDEIELDRYKQHTIEAVVDRLVITHEGAKEDKKAALTRLTDSVETALKFGGGYIMVNLVDKKEDVQFSEHLACPEDGTVIQEVEPRTFFQHTAGRLPGLPGTWLQTGD